jgi:beta-glucanase (GH16 family)
MEQDSNKTITSGAFHFPDGQGNHTYTYNYISVNDSAGTWHVYAMEWTADTINLMVDNVIFHTLDNKNNTYFDNEHFILLNTAMGGALGGSIASDFSSAIMEIDYVRVYQLQSLSTPSTFKKELLLYPNPCDGNFQFESRTLIEEVHIYKLNGQKLQSFQPNKKVFTIHSNLPKGLYLVEISGSNFREIKRLMIK